MIGAPENLQIGFLRAGDFQVLGAGYDGQRAVFVVALIDRQPRRDAGAGFDAQIIVVLMQRLAARARGLEVEHRLRQQRLFADQLIEDRADVRIQRCAHRERADGQLALLVGMHHARKTVQRIAAILFRIPETFDRAEFAGLREGVANFGDLLRRIHTLYDHKAVALEGFELFVCKHPGSCHHEHESPLKGSAAF